MQSDSVWHFNDEGEVYELLMVLPFYYEMDFPSCLFFLLYSSLRQIPFQEIV